MSADSYADLLEGLFGDYEGRHTIAVIEKIVSESRAQLAGQSPPGAHRELLDRLARQRLIALGAPPRRCFGHYDLPRPRPPGMLRRQLLRARRRVVLVQYLEG